MTRSSHPAGGRGPGVDAIQDMAVVITDGAGVVIGWNPGAQRLYGWLQEEALGARILDLLVPDGSAEGGDGRETGSPWAGEITVRRKDGSSVRCEAIDRPVLGAGGELIAVVGISREASGASQPQPGKAFASIPPLHEDVRIPLALEVSGLGTWRWDAESGEVEWDEALERLYGLSPGSFPGTYEAYLQLLHPADREQVISAVRTAMETHGEHHVEHRVLWADGSVRWIEGWGRVTLGADGQPSGLLGVSADVTRRRRNEIRLRRLQSVTAALANARTIEEVGEVAVHELLNAADALGSTLALLDADGRRLRVVATSLPDAALPDHWRTFDIDSPFTSAEAVRTGRVVLRSVAEAEGPSAAVAKMGGELSERAVVLALPIRVGDRTFGAIGLALPSLTHTDQGSVDFLVTLCNQFGQALERAKLYEAERQASERVLLLAEASRSLGASLDYQQTITEVVNSAVPTFADWCTVDLLNEQGELELLAVAHVEPAKVELAWDLRKRYPPDPEALTGAPNVVRTGRSELIPSIPPELLAQAIDLYPELRDLIEELHLTSAMTVPLPVGGRVLGAMSFVWGESERHYDEADLQIAEELGRRAAVAIDNARLFDERSRVADTLQSSLRPPTLPEIPGLELAARYRPGGAHGEVAGDFYDVFPLREGSWLAVVGDVCGKGVEAAAVMALARYTIRTAALSRMRPSGILATLNEALLRSEMDRFCTVCAVRIDEGDDAVRLTVSSGGHPQPVVISGKEARFVDVRGTLLGVFPDPEFRDQTVELGPGDTLLLYTDGVTEERLEHDLFGDARLLDLARKGEGDTASGLASRLVGAVERFGSEPPADDIAVLVIKNARRAAPSSA